MKSALHVVGVAYKREHLYVDNKSVIFDITHTKTWLLKFVHKVVLVLHMLRIIEIFFYSISNTIFRF